MVVDDQSFNRCGEDGGLTPPPGSTSPGRGYCPVVRGLAPSTAAADPSLGAPTAASAVRSPSVNRLGSLFNSINRSVTSAFSNFVAVNQPVPGVIQDDDRPVVTPPSVTPSSVSPPSVTPPIVSPPIVTPPIVTPPIMTPPIMSPPSVTLPSVTPPSVTPPSVPPALQRQQSQPRFKLPSRRASSQDSTGSAATTVGTAASIPRQSSIAAPGPSTPERARVQQQQRAADDEGSEAAGTKSAPPPPQRSPSRRPRPLVGLPINDLIADPAPLYTSQLAHRRNFSTPRGTVLRQFLPRDTL